MHQELQDQDQLGSPHLEEKRIGGNIDLDLLSLSLKDMLHSVFLLKRGDELDKYIINTFLSIDESIISNSYK